jgi:P-type Mg2+ transporter
VIPTATVLRDGTWIETPVRNVVPGDVFRLPADDLVPADARLLESRDLSVQQSMLTGESLPADKIATADGEEAFGPDAPHLVFLGTQSSAAALRDTQIGRAIAVVHREPGHN